MTSLSRLTGTAALTLAALLGTSAPLPAQAARTKAAPGVEVAPGWTRGATCYEVFIRSFMDSDGDGIGDLNGLTSKLDYLNDGNPKSTRSLGARCIWLMPVAQSPSYHGYDVSDYYTVEKDYGTNADFKRMVREAHRRGIRVVVDMVLNHMSNEHPAFQAALRDTASPYRSWFRFARTKPATKGPWGQDPWVKSPVRDEYYYAVFSPHMPDLNYENPAVLREAKKIARFWVRDMNVDGFRLDAVRYLGEDHGMLQDSPDTHAALAEYQRYVRSLKRDIFTVGEVYAPSDIVLSYYPDQLTSYFAFEVADSIVAGVNRRSAAHVLAPALRMQREAPAGRWSPFLRNHDQPRTRTELGDDMAKSRVASLLLLTLPGMPFVYYGEEIGMTGAKPDERLRTPMQWSPGKGAGFTTGRPWQRLADDSTTVSVAQEEGDSTSLLALHRRLIHLRDRNPALAGGTIVPLTTGRDDVLAYVRRDGAHAVLVVANLGAAPATGVAISSAANALPAGRWRLRSLLDASAASPLQVGADGSISGYVPLATLEGTRGYLFELVSSR